MYLLLRHEGLSAETAVFGALAFEAMPKLFAHYGAGHISLIYAISWTPWLLYTHRYRYTDDTPLRSGWLGLLCQPGLVLALVLLADVRWGFYAGVLWWGYSFAHSQQHRQRSEILRHLNVLIFQSLLGLLLAAPLLLPFAEYTRLSTRMEVKPENLFVFSLPPLRLFGLLFPDFGGFYEWVLYPGGVVILLALLGFWWRGAKIVIRFWQLTVLISLVLSLGAYLPGMESITSFPGLNLLRVPSRWLFITGIGLAALAAHCLERIGNELEPITKKRLNLALVALSMLAITWSIAIWVITKDYSPSNLWGSLIILAGSLCIYLLINRHMSFHIGILLLILLCATDLMITNVSLFESKAAETVLAEASDEATQLGEDGSKYRIYTPSYSMPQHIAVNNAFELANGVDPLQLSGYVDYMEQASGVPITGYSVVLPPIADGDPNTANSAYQPDPYLLGLINVKYVLAAYPLQVEGLVEENVDSSILYINHEVQPRAWVQPLDVPTGEEISPVDVSVYQPNHIEVEAEGPGLLVLSEIMYPGWRAQIDGKPIEIQPVMGILRSIILKMAITCSLTFYRSAYNRIDSWGIGLVMPRWEHAGEASDITQNLSGFGNDCGTPLGDGLRDDHHARYNYPLFSWLCKPGSRMAIYRFYLRC
jgi:ABC-type proline/glycine betaine transport system permease subunit